MYSAVVFRQVLQRRLEPWRWGVQWPAIESWLRPIERLIEADPLKTAPEIAKELSVNHSKVIWYLKRTGKVKKLIKWVPHELDTNQKIVVLKSHLLLYHAITMNHFSIGSWRVTQSRFYTTNDDDHLSAWTEKKLQSTSQSQTCTKKRVMVTVWGSVDSLIHYSSLKPGKSIKSVKYAQQIRERHWKLQHLQLASVSTKGPVLNACLHMAQPVLQKWN